MINKSKGKKMGMNEKNSISQPYKAVLYYKVLRT